MPSFVCCSLELFTESLSLFLTFYFTFSFLPKWALAVPTLCGISKSLCIQKDVLIDSCFSACMADMRTVAVSMELQPAMMAKRGWCYYTRNITRPRTESVSLENRKNLDSRSRNRAVSKCRREHCRPRWSNVTHIVPPSSFRHHCAVKLHENRDSFHIRHTGTEARINQHVSLNA